jgi:acyl-CoA thioesterase-2
MSASFQISEPGLEHQDPAPRVPDPDELESLAQYKARGNAGWSIDPDEWAAIDVRRVEETAEAGSPDCCEVGRLRVWLKAAEPLPDDPLLHAAVLAYASDLTLLAAALVPHPVQIGDPQLFSASLDHAMWFHRPFRADEWLLHDEHSPSAGNARGLGQGRVFSRDGRLVATTVQEGLMRVGDPAP